jgi:outer membrane protein insertion porin family
MADLIELNTSWSYEARDRSLFPTAGSAHTFSFNATAPGSDLEYFTASYKFEQYWRLPLPLIRNVPFRFTSTLGFGGAYGGTTALPPTRHWFVGGPDSVRGFRESTLGPRDSIGNPYGGDSALYGSLEAILPMPQKWQTSARLFAFYDIGQAFYLGNTTFRDKLGKRADTGFSLQRLRRSAGLGVEWLSPMGLFRFSYAIPLQYQRETDRLFGDERERFQFSIGQAF